MADLPDFFSPFVVKGWDGTEYKTLRVTTAGELYILLSALYNSTITPLKCDENGNAFFNVKAQDLAEVINRPKYGAANISGGFANCPDGESTVLTTIAGKGVTYGGYWYLNPAITHNTDICQIEVDGNLIPAGQFDWWNRLNFTQPGNGVSFLNCYDTNNRYYAMSLMFGITFETSFTMRYYNNEASDVSIQYRLIYALV